MAKVVAIPAQKAPSPEQCGECLFWKEKSENVGECHRYPPSTQECRFPIVLGINWCGEFKRKS